MPSLIGKQTYYDSVDKYTMENGVFIGSDEGLKALALGANSPWSVTCESYKIRYNHSNDYSYKKDGEPNYVCEYVVLGYDAIETIIYGYGDTVQSTLQNCMDNFTKLQKEYNENNNSF